MLSTVNRCFVILAEVGLSMPEVVQGPHYTSYGDDACESVLHSISFFSSASRGIRIIFKISVVVGSFCASCQTRDWLAVDLSSN